MRSHFTLYDTKIEPTNLHRVTTDLESGPEQ